MYKPVILLGAGARAYPKLIDYLSCFDVPILTTWMGMDLIAEDHPNFCGRPGVFGQRASNIIQQKADLLLCIGARLDGEQVAYDYTRFAPNAKVFVWDIDEMEWQKFPTRYHCVNSIDTFDFGFADVDPRWLSWCKSLYARFRPELEGKQNDGYVDTFAFLAALSEAARDTDLLAVGSSSGAVNSFFQTFKVKRGQRCTCCASIGAMGADIPMAIGGCLASGRRTICITGDGGFQLNTQDLETIQRLNLPITFFVFSNGGYNSIRVMQDARFEGRHVGCNAESGYTMPQLDKLAFAYGINYTCLDSNPTPLELSLLRVLGDKPLIVEVKTDPNWQQLPRVMASTVNGQLRTDDMERMYPYLPENELEELMKWEG